MIDSQNTGQLDSPLTPTQWWVSATAPSPKRTNPPTWDQTDAEFERIAGLEDNWDGDGSGAPSGDLIEGARRLADELRRSGVPTPTSVLPSRSGTVVLEWALSDRDLELEVIAPDVTKKPSTLRKENAPPLWPGPPSHAPRSVATARTAAA